MICSSSRYFRQNLPSIDFYSRHPCQRSSIQSTFPFYRFCSISPTRFSHPRRPGCRLFLTFLFFILMAHLLFCQFVLFACFQSIPLLYPLFFSYVHSLLLLPRAFHPFYPFSRSPFLLSRRQAYRRQLLRDGDRYCERNRSRRACESCVSTRLQNASFFSPSPRSTTRGVSARFACFVAYPKDFSHTPIQSLEPTV